MTTSARAAVAVLASAFVLAGCGSQPAATGSLSGHVIRVTCGGAVPANQPARGCGRSMMAGVTVVFQPTGGGSPINAGTNDAGMYAAILPAGSYRVSIVSVGPQGQGPTPSQVAVKADQHQDIDFVTTFMAM